MLKDCIAILQKYKLDEVIALLVLLTHINERAFMRPYLLILLTLAVALAGCASIGHKVDQTKVAQIKKGVTTKAQVLD